MFGSPTRSIKVLPDRFLLSVGAMKFAVPHVVAITVAAVVLAGCSGHHETSEPDAKARLSALSQQLAATQGLHVTGFAMTNSGQKAELDLQISNTGEAVGTLSAGGQPMKYIAVDNTEFLRGNAAAWQALGSKEDQAKLYDDRWVGLPTGLFAKGLAQTLGSAALGQALSAGKPDSNADSPTTIHSGDMTVYVGHDTGGQDTIDKIDFSPFADASPTSGLTGDNGADQALWLSVALAKMTRRQIDDLYNGLRDTLPGAIVGAVDPKVKLSWDGRSGPCAPGTCSFQITLKNWVVDDPQGRIKHVRVRYSVTGTVDGRQATPGAGCDGFVDMSPNSSLQLSCTFTFPVTSLSGWVHAELTADATGYEQDEADRMQRQAIANRAKVTALPDFTPPK
ncbi:hypothetical protein AB0I30_01750 [Nocardia tengchongensis]|uniref:hypothetical protein n=1 Tax=Nocardia tengchongensis TaxID=2055889 RepID=UPI0033F39F06